METKCTLDHEWFQHISDIDGENSDKSDEKLDKSIDDANVSDAKVVIIRYGLTEAYFRGASELVAIELPEVGRSLTAGDVYGTLEFSKAVFELETPLTGRVHRINQDVLDHSQRLLEDPTGTGWLLEIMCSLTEWNQWTP